MKKIIQISTDIEGIHCLTEDGKVYVRSSKREQVCKGDNLTERTRWKNTLYWEEIPVEESIEVVQPPKRPF